MKNEMKYRLQHGLISNNCLEWKSPGQKVPTILFQVYKNLENADYSDRKQINSCLGMRNGKQQDDRLQRGQEHFGMIDMLTCLTVVIVSQVYTCAKT